MLLKDTVIMLSIYQNQHDSRIGMLAAGVNVTHTLQDCLVALTLLFKTL